MNVYQCDICSVVCYIHPPTELQVEHIPERDEEGAIRLIPKPVLVDFPTFNASTGKMEMRRMQATRDLKLRCYSVRLSLGMQYVQKDLCEKCYKQHFKILNESFRYIDSLSPESRDDYAN